MSQPSLGAQKLWIDANLEQRHEGTSGALEGLAGERDELAEEGAKAMEGL